MTTDEELQAAHKVYGTINAAMMELWKQKRAEWMTEGGLDHVKFGRQSALSFAHLAALMAMDSGMTEEQLLAVVKKFFEIADQSAQRFS